VESGRGGRADFGLLEDECVYLSPQSVFKYLPEYDEIFPRIAARVPASKVVLIRPANSNVADQLEHRMLQAFARHGLDGREFLVFVPVQREHQDYLRLNSVADVFLDQPGWSGGMTTLEALGCDLPVVTWPGRFMRGRHAAAFLRQLGLEQTIASDVDDFVDIAARLGADAVLRQSLRRAVAAQKHRLFNDASCQQALERFYGRAVSVAPRSNIGFP
jgi:predicted O-linked N-acetylglucosamine transferase (SPINDLY family)